MYDNIERLDGTNEDDLLLEKFVGKKYDILRSKLFSWPTFFFAEGYYFFRKMIGRGLLLFLIRLIFIYGLIFLLANYLPVNQINEQTLMVIIIVIMSIVTIIISVIISLLTNKIYMRFARKKVIKIQDKYVGKDIDELAEICEKKGGTSILMLFLGVIIECVLLGIISLLVNLAMKPFMDRLWKYDYEETPGIQDGDEHNHGNYENDEIKISDYFSYSIPDTFSEGIFNSDTKLDYYYDENPDIDDECSFILEINEDFVDEEDLIMDLQADNNEIIEEESDIVINNLEWKKLAIQKDYGIIYYYVVEANDILFDLAYEIENEAPEVCYKYKEEIINSIYFNIFIE